MLNNRTKIRKCVFPVAGYGTRFLPATKSMPKEMLPIVNKPLIQYGVEECIDAEMTNMTFVTGRGKRAIADHFDTSYEFEHQIAGTPKEELLKGIREIMEKGNFSFIRQHFMGGLGHAILTAEPLVGNEPFGAVLADDLCITDNNPIVMKQMMEEYNKHQCCIVAIEEVPKDKVSSYGVIAGTPIDGRDDLFCINEMVEKPSIEEAPSNYAIIGRYILTPDIFTYIKNTKPGRGGEIQLTDALREKAKDSKVLAYKFKGNRFDCGSMKGFVEATNYCYNKLMESQS